MEERKIIDIAIIGAGPAGLSAALYSARALNNTVVFEKGVEGGQIMTTTTVDNYPGAPENSTGPTIVERMKEQALSFGAQIRKENVVSLSKEKDLFEVKTDSSSYQARAVIAATGAVPRKLAIPGEEKFTGLGVSYCATCDGAFFKDMDVCVIGGGDTALKEADYLTRFAKTVTVIHRRNQFRASKNLVENAKNNPKIKLMTPFIPLEIKGDFAVDEIVLENKETGEKVTYPTMGVFVFAGYIPNTTLFEPFVSTDKSGYIQTDAILMTKTKGLFAAGDIREKSLRQVITAASDGAIAAVSAYEYLSELFY